MKNTLLGLLLLFPFFMNAQGVSVPLGGNTYHIMDRLEIKSGLGASFHTAIKYYIREDVTNFAIAVDTSMLELTKGDQADLNYIFKDNNEWLTLADKPSSVTSEKPIIYKKVYTDSTNTFYTYEETELPASAKTNNQRYFKTNKPLLKHFYKTPANFLELDTDNFYLKINPIINFKLANAKDDEDIIFTNQRGAEIRGAIDNRIYFYSSILESQSQFPDYVTDRIISDKAVPGAGLFKPYRTSIFNINKGYDYLNAQGYLAFNISKHFGLQMGHGRHFIGNGYRSLFLSDYAHNYFYLKFNTKVWKFHYQNIFAELSAEGSRDNTGNEILGKKYMAAHYISYKPNPNLSFGIFETVIFNRKDHFEFQYLNPIILYRTVEQFIDSPDNVLIGIDAKWNFLKRFSLYAQLMMDEFKFDELFIERRGWWANKYGLQLGLKYIDAFGIDHLDAQVEYNLVRPYTYQHKDSTSNYTHFNQALAHPVGANFKEYILRLRYQPIPKLIMEGRLISINSGEDINGSNWGTNLLYDYGNRPSDFENEIGQGVATDIMIAGLDVSYELFHNIYVDLHYFYRKKDSAENVRDNTTNYIGGGFRMNIGQQRLEY